MTENWTRVASAGDLEPDDVVQVKVGDQLIALYNLDGRYFATSDICTHEYACLSDGFVEDGMIECPLHQGLFDITTGKAQGAPVDVDLKTFPVRIDGNDVLIDV